MKNSWRFFCIVVLLLLLFILWQIFHNPIRATFMLLGILFLIVSNKKSKKRKKRLQIFGALLVGITLMNTSSFWLLLVFIVLFVGLKGIEFTGITPYTKKIFGKKNLIIVETKEPEKHRNSRKKIKWFGDERIGTSVFEWDDLTLFLFFGDTIIDLGNTLLPKKDNVMVLTKGIGDTKVLVPNGIGIKLEHQGLYGDIKFEGETIELKNEKIVLYSEGYEEDSRKLTIISSSLIGELEVIRI